MQKIRNFVFGLDANFEAIIDYLTNNEKVSKFFNEKKKLVKSDDLSYRIINHWEAEGVIDDNRPNGKGWRKYSILDSVWIRTIQQLRKFGLPLEQIRKVKESLFGKKGEERENLLFEYNIVLAFFRNTPIYLLVFPDGQAIIVNNLLYNKGIEFNTIQDDHIKISLNNILQRIFPKKDLAPNYELNHQLKKEELEVLEMIRFGNYESVTVKSKDGKIERIEAMEHIDSEKRIIDIINERKYQDIQIKQTNGKVVCIKRIVKKKIQ